MSRAPGGSGQLCPRTQTGSTLHPAVGTGAVGTAGDAHPEGNQVWSGWITDPGSATQGQGCAGLAGSRGSVPGVLRGVGDPSQALSLLP